MEKKLWVLFVIIAGYFVSCDTYPKDDIWYAEEGRKTKELNKLPPGEPGKCYAKMETSDQIKERSIQLPIYTGSDQAIVDKYVRDTILVLSEESSKWVKKPRGNCRSADPKDCLVWCLEKTPREEIEVKNYLGNQNQTNEYKMESFVRTALSKSGGDIEWVEVLCQNEITKSLINELAEGLRVRGFMTSSAGVTSASNEEFQDALVAFQRKKGIHVGGLSRETVNQLMFK